MSVNTDMKQTTKAQSWLLYAASGLVLIMGLILYLLPGSTETFFAWTIGVPLTAAFLGAGYLASFSLEFMAARESFWARARIALPTAFVFTSLTLIVTLLHLDKFHFNSSNISTLIITWAWILVYVFVPFIMIVIYIQQRRSTGNIPPVNAPLPRWFKAILALQGSVLLVLGIGLLFVPMTVAPLWAWELTPLTGRAIGAWLMGLGTAAIHSVIENDWVRLRPAILSYSLYGTLQLINLLRFPDAQGLDWSLAKTWVYFAFILSFLLVGLYGIWQSRPQANTD